MTDTVNVDLGVIQRAVVMAKAIMKAEPLYGCVGYHGDDQINGHVEEAADLACLVLDEMADHVPAPNALAAAPKAEPLKETSVMPCPQCDGEGEYADGIDEAACSTPCARCLGNGWLVDIGSAQPEAQKVEQEPSFLGHVIIYPDGRKPDFAPASEDVSVGESCTVTAAFSHPWHPALASDELLEAADHLVNEFAWSAVVADCEEARKELQQRINRLRAAIAKHKGPQS